MRYLLTALFSMFLVSASFASGNTARLSGGKIIIDRPDGPKVLDYSQKVKYSNYDLKKWDIEKETDVIEEALEVYKKKSEPLYSQKVWIINKNGTEKILLEYKSADEEDSIIFTNDENYVFYLGVSDAGQSIVYGMNLAAGGTTTLNNATSFFIETCPDNDTYVITQDDDGDKEFYVYRVLSESIDEIDYNGSIDDLTQALCY